MRSFSLGPAHAGSSSTLRTSLLSIVATQLTIYLSAPSFYGINLNQNVVLQQIGFAGKKGTPWERLFKVSIGNLIITALGFVPGKYISVTRSRLRIRTDMRQDIM